MSIWADIVTTAVVGTERQALPASAVDAALQALYAQLETADREGALLHAAALTALYERAGRLPAKSGEASPEAAPAETLPRCNTRVAARLRMLLQRGYDDLFAEFLAALAQTSQRVPEEVLPVLLETGKAKETLANLLPPVIGAHGIWLGQQNVEWAYICGDTQPEAVWQVGTLAQRRALLKRLRQTQPQEAIALLQQTWEQDSPKERAEFIALLGNGLSEADEAFLENALDGQWTIVCKSAVGLLAKLPDSAFVKRMCARVQPLLRFKKGLLGKLSIEITLPAERDDAMARDGIVKAPPPPQSNERAWWLQQMLSSVPPVFWEQQSGWSIEQLLQTIKRHEYRELLLDSWREAARRTNSADWLKQLLNSFKDRHWNQKLFAAVPSERQEQLLTQIFAESQNWESPAILKEYLAVTSPQWSESFSLRLLETICSNLSSCVLPDDWTIRGLLTTIGCRLHPDTLALALKNLSETAAVARIESKELEGLLSLLQFRFDMLQELHQ
jgi:hypothetical protein